MNRLEELIIEGSHLVLPVLEGKRPVSDYVDVILEIIPVLLETDEKTIRELSVIEPAKMTLISDRVLLSHTITEKPDQISLISTLLAYVESREEGMPDHSRIYMDRVTALRKMIEIYLKSPAQKFCGS